MRGATGLSVYRRRSWNELTYCNYLQNFFRSGHQFGGLVFTWLKLSGTLGGNGQASGDGWGLPLWGFNGVKENANYYLTDQGLVLFFQPYEIAPYSEGIVKIMVPYQELADVMAFETE